MTMIERAQQEGVDPELLVGWVEIFGGDFGRMTKAGTVVEISEDCNGVSIWQIDQHRPAKGLADALKVAEAMAKIHGRGWAPAPIGFSRDEWNYDMESVPLGRTIQISTRDDSYPSGLRVRDRAWKESDTGNWVYKDWTDHVLLLHADVYAWRLIPILEPAPLPTPPKEVG